MNKCQYCGKQYMFMHGCPENPQVLERFSQEFRQASEKNQNTVVLKDNALSTLDFYMKAGDKFGYSFKDSIVSQTTPSGLLYTFLFEKPQQPRPAL